jgi:hypothetical protein
VLALLVGIGLAGGGEVKDFVPLRPVENEVAGDEVILNSGGSVPALLVGIGVAGGRLLNSEGCVPALLVENGEGEAKVLLIVDDGISVRK